MNSSSSASARTAKVGHISLLGETARGSVTFGQWLTDILSGITAADQSETHRSMHSAVSYVVQVASLVGGSIKSNEASTMLLLTDNRSSVQLAAAEGSAQNWDFGMLAGFFKGGLAGAHRFSNSPQGKVLAASLKDSYNQMVKAVRSYKAQSVEGGLGNGGLLHSS